MNESPAKQGSRLCSLEARHTMTEEQKKVTFFKRQVNRYSGTQFQ